MFCLIERGACTVFSPRKVWTNDTCDQASKDATCSQYCSQPQTKWARNPKVRHGQKPCGIMQRPKWLPLGVAIFMPVRLCPESPGARTQYFGLSWVQHLSSNMQVLFKFCECKRTTKIFKNYQNLTYDLYIISIYIGVCFCLFNVWWVCMQVLQARAHEGILAKHLRNSTRSTMKLISLVIGACWCNSWHLHKAPSCSFQPKEKTCSQQEKCKRKAEEQGLRSKHSQKISENIGKRKTHKNVNRVRICLKASWFNS